MKNVVRDLREAAGLSQYELGERAGVAQPNIAAYEAGRSRPPATMLQRLRSAARALPHDALDAHRDDLVALAARYGLSNIRVFGSALRRSDTPGSDPDNVPRLAMESLIIKVGENVARLSAETIGRHPNVPSSAVKRMGDRLAHHYAGTDYDAVWDTLVVDFPAIRAHIQPLIRCR